MRKQTVKVKTGMGKRILVGIIISIVLCLALAGCWMLYHYERPFVPPEFEENAKEGVPEVEESLNYGTVTAPTGFSIGLCGTMYQQEDGSLIVNLTNPETNTVNIQCEVKDKTGNTLYKSGVIEPGEYLEKLTPLVELKQEAVPIEISVYGYEIDTWYSKGTIMLDNTLQPY